MTRQIEQEVPESTEPNRVSTGRKMNRRDFLKLMGAVAAAPATLNLTRLSELLQGSDKTVFAGRSEGNTLIAIVDNNSGAIDLNIGQLENIVEDDGTPATLIRGWLNLVSGEASFLYDDKNNPISYTHSPRGGTKVNRNFYFYTGKPAEIYAKNQVVGSMAYSESIVGKPFISGKAFASITQDYATRKMLAMSINFNESPDQTYPRYALYPVEPDPNYMDRFPRILDAGSGRAKLVGYATPEATATPEPTVDQKEIIFEATRTNGEVVPFPTPAFISNFPEDATQEQVNDIESQVLVQALEFIASSNVKWGDLKASTFDKANSSELLFFEDLGSIPGVSLEGAFNFPYDINISKENKFLLVYGSVSNELIDGTIFIFKNTGDQWGTVLVNIDTETAVSIIKSGSISISVKSN